MYNICTASYGCCFLAINVRIPGGVEENSFGFDAGSDFTEETKCNTLYMFVAAVQVQQENEIQSKDREKCEKCVIRLENSEYFMTADL